MPDARVLVSSEPAMTPEEIAERAFATSFRGFDQTEVRQFLQRVSDELTHAVERQRELRRALDDALDRAAHPEVEESVLTAVLGEQTTRILRSAREAAADIRAKAEDNVARMMREAQEEATRLRSEAESVLTARVQEAEAAAAAIRSSAEADAQALRTHARAEADTEVEAARERGREMVAEAQAVRERILSDLARRRRQGLLQVEQLRAGRERLLETYKVVRRTLDEATDELSVAEAEARLAAEAAARKLASEADRGAGDVERELAALRHDDPLPPRPPSTHPSDRFADAESPRADASTSTPTFAPVAPVADEPAVDAPAPDERRSSSLRILRGGGFRSEPEHEAQPEPEVGASETVVDQHEAEEPAPASTPLDTIDTGSPEESVRIVLPVSPVYAEAARAEGLVDEPHSDFLSPVGSAGTDLDDPHGDLATDVPEVPESAPFGAGEPMPTDAGDTAAEPEAAGAAVAVETSPRERPSVDELFARIKAARAEAVTQAKEVLAEPEPGADAAESLVEPEAEPHAAGEDVTPDEVEAHDDLAGDVIPSDGDEAELQRRDALLEPLEASLAKKLKRALQDEQNEVLERLRTVKGAPTAATVLPSVAEQASRYEAAAASVMEEAARAGAQFVQADAAHEADAAEPVADLVADLAAELVGELREQLELALVETAGDDVDVDATGVSIDAPVIDRLGSSYRQCKSQRIEPLARHHLTIAFTGGALRATADGAHMRWVVDDDGGPCPDCDDNALAGPTPKGERYPTGQLHPPAHPGCRCLLVPAED